jgi:hypothetical protein
MFHSSWNILVTRYRREAKEGIIHREIETYQLP